MHAGRVSRRRLLATGIAAAAGAVLAACTPGRREPTAGGTTSGAVPTGSPPAAGAPLIGGDFGDTAVCSLTREDVLGPFFLDTGLERSDITEDREGRPLRVGLQVVDLECLPVAGAVVHLWHADAEGDYSAFLDGSSTDEAGEGTTFLRGSQVTDDEGIVEFRTIHPGWYPGRTPHLHVVVGVDGVNWLTTQLYFPDEHNDRVLAEGPYASRGERDTRNDGDLRGSSAAGEPGNRLTLSSDGDGDLGRARLGIGLSR
jgi:protocatechuate 3,4-dioxygenase beta subunit